MRLLTYKAAAPRGRGQGLRPRGRAGPPAVRRQGHADRPRRRAAARRPRLRQGAPGRAVVPRPAGHRRHGRSGARLMPSISTTRRSSARWSAQAHQVAMNMLRPISRKYDLAEHEYPKELDMLAAMIDGLAESGAVRGGRCGRRTPRARGTDDGANQERHQPRLGHVDRRDVLGRRRAAAVDAAPGAGQLRDRLGGRRRAARAVRRACGPAMAITEPGTGSDSANIRTTAVAGRRRVRPQRREDLRDLRRARRRRRRVGDARQAARPGGDQVVRGPEGHAGDAGRAARAQARHPGVRHRDDQLRGLPGAGGEPARLARGRRTQAGLRRRDGDLRQHPPAGGRRWRSAAPPRRST